MAAGAIPPKASNSCLGKTSVENESVGRKASRAPMPIVPVGLSVTPAQPAKAHIGPMLVHQPLPVRHFLGVSPDLVVHIGGIIKPYANCCARACSGAEEHPNHM